MEKKIYDTVMDQKMDLNSTVLIVGTRGVGKTTALNCTLQGQKGVVKTGGSQDNLDSALFSSLDLAAGYWLVQMDSVPREDGLFRSLRITENAFRIGQCSSYVPTINGDRVGRSGPRWMSHLS